MSLPETHNPDVILAPTVSTSPSGEVPKAPYTARIISAVDGKSENSGSRMITFSCEIIAPDVQPSQLNPGTSCQTAGRKFNMYAVIDPASKAFTGGYALLQKLLLLREDGAIVPSAVVNACANGNLFFMVILEGEEDFHRLPKKPGQKIGDIMVNPANGQPMTRGFRMKLPGESEVIGRCHAPEGYVAAAF